MCSRATQDGLTIDWALLWSLVTPEEYGDYDVRMELAEAMQICLGASGKTPEARPQSQPEAGQ